MEINKAFKLTFSNWPVLWIGFALIFGSLFLGLILGFIPVVGPAIAQVISLVVGFIVLGYTLSVASNFFKKKKFTKLHKFSFKENFKKGFFGMIIQFIYSLPLVILGICLYVYYLPILEGFEETMLSSPEVLMSILGTLVTWILIALVLIILIHYFRMSALVAYSRRFKFKDAFTKDVFRKACTKKYLGAWFVGGLIYGLIFVALLVTFIFAYVLFPFWAFAGGIFYYSLVADAYSKIK